MTLDDDTRPGGPPTTPPFPELMRRKRRWPKAVLALAVVAGLVAGGIAYKDHHDKVEADKRRRAAMAAENKAVATYRKAVTPLLVPVYDLVQPVQDADDAYAHPYPGIGLAQDDVIHYAYASPLLKATATQLKRLSVPRSMTVQAAALQKGMTQLTAALARLNGATHAKTDELYNKQLTDAYSGFTIAEDYWYGGLQAVFTETERFPSPSADRAGAFGRKVQTHGHFILEADGICGRVENDLGAFDEKASFSAQLAHVTKLETALRSSSAQLLRLRVSPSDPRGAQHAFTIALQGITAPADALAKEVRAARAHDQAAAAAAYRLLLSTLPSLSRLSHAFGDYGANTCRLLFQVDDAAKRSSGTAA